MYVNYYDMIYIVISILFFVLLLLYIIYLWYPKVMDDLLICLGVKVVENDDQDAMEYSLI